MNNIFGCANFTNRDALITCLYTSKVLDESINGMAKGKEMREELKQELFLRICELDPEELERIYENEYLDYYIIRTLRNMFDSKTSQFYTRIKRGILERSNYEIDVTNTPDETYSEVSVEDAMKKLNWFEQQVIELYSEHGNMAKIADITGTSPVYVAAVLASARKKLKNALCN